MAFEELAVKDLKIVAGLPTIFAMDVSPSRRNGSLVAFQLIEDGKIAVGVVAQFESSVAIDDLKMAAEIHKWALQYKPKLIAYDKYATMSIAERLTQSNQKCEDMSGQVFYQACGQLLDSVVSGRIVHNGSESLVASMNNCAAKTNDAGWRIIRRKSAGDVSAAIALAMVNHQLLKPQSKPMIMFDTP
jgi:phage terminase large subunit-like protein